MKEERKQRNGVNRRFVWRWWRFGVKEVFCEHEGSYEGSCERASRLFFFLRSIVSLSSGSGDQAMA